MREELKQIKPLVPGKKPADVTVVVAMSGGVDSSAVTAILHQLGYNVIGMTLQLWDYTPSSQEEGKKFGTCCALDDVYDAKRVCQTLDVPHYTINMESAFKDAVIDDFVETYLAGATPIPCVRCNERIKFDALLNKAKSLGADVLVTGHYIQKDYKDGRAVLKRGLDASKDQSYYLFTTTQEQLEFSDFPLGALTKDVTRDIAKELGLHLHQKKDSQDICFVPGGDYRKVVKKFAPQADKPGNIVTEDGDVVGQHEGIIGYTVGQRKGLGGGFTDPMYCVEIRPHSNEIVIGPESSLFKSSFTIKDLNWIGADAPDGLSVKVKVRAQHEPVPAKLKALENGRYDVITSTPERQISPGQAAVFYDDEDIMLGGGWIEVPEIAKLGTEIKVDIQDHAS